MLQTYRLKKKLIPPIISKLVLNILLKYIVFKTSSSSYELFHLKEDCWQFRIFHTETISMAALFSYKSSYLT